MAETPAAIDSATDPHANPYRWVVLGAFTLVAGLSQLLWLNFAPLLTQVQQRYHVSEFMASLLLLVFPLIYVFLSVPAGVLIDKKGYKYAIGLGSVLMAVFAVLRLVDNFWALLIGQIGIAIGQPYVINGISKLVLDWFSERQSAIATGLGTMGMFIGMAVGLALTPVLAQSLGFTITMVVFAGMAIAGGGAFLALAKPNPQAAPEPAPSGESKAAALLKDKNLLLLYSISFLGLGFFNGLTSWLEPILAPQGIDAVKAGIIGAMLIVGGIFGSVIVPGLSDKFRRRKPFLIGSTVVAGLTLYPLCTGRDYGALLVLGALQGFFFLPAYALLLEMCSEVAGEALAGSATGILMLTGNAGGVVVIMAMEAVKGKAPTFINGVHLMMGTLVLAVLLSLVLSETFHLKGRKM